MRVGIVAFGSMVQPTSGLPRRALAVTYDLIDLGADVSIVSVEEPAEAELVRGVARVPVTAISGPFRYGLARGLLREMKNLVHKADVLIVESAQLLPAVYAARARVPVIWDTTELETLHYRRLPKSLRNVWNAAIWWVLERWAAGRVDVVVAVSLREAEWWKELFPVCRGRCMVVDHRPAEQADQPEGGTDRDHRSGDLVFLGNLNSKHNAEAARWIATELAPNLAPTNRLLLVGPGTDKIRIEPSRGAEVIGLGEVDDFRPILNRAAFGLAPLSAGAGVKTKVLDYVACGLRVVGTEAAFEGIESCPGLITAPLDQFAEALTGLLAAEESSDSAAERRVRQMDYLEAHHGSARTQRQWVDVFARVGLRL